MSGTHRNKESSEYISLDDNFEFVHIDKSAEIRKFGAGDSASPELCGQYCMRKNRGHTHPIPGKGGDRCLAKTDCGFAIHSDKEFKSSCKKLCFYDFVSCDTYWKKLGWVPPVQSKNPEVQSTFSKCNFSCGHSSHTENKKIVYCEDDNLHSMSNNYCDHNFKCNHEEIIVNDVVFIVDVREV